MSGAYRYLYAKPEEEEPTGGGISADQSEDGSSAQTPEPRSRTESTA